MRIEKAGFGLFQWLIVCGFVALFELNAASALALDEAVPTEIAPAPVRIGVFGDSLGDGMWMGLSRHFRRDPAVEGVERLSQASIGITNYIYVDVAEKTRDQLLTDSFDIAIVMFGANDIQGISHNNRVHRFRSAGWEAVYRARIDELVDLLHANGAQVYWVGLPRMRSAGYDANTIYLNSLFAEQMTALGATFIETRSVSADVDGEYGAYLPDASGTQRLMRADDGIHFTMRGYRRLAAPVVDQLRLDWENARQDQTDHEEPLPAVMVSHAPGTLTIDVNGTAYVCQPAGEFGPLFTAPPSETGTDAGARSSP